MKLLDLAIAFRVLNLYAHHAHNMTRGTSFLSDHEFFNSIYDFADDAYDSVVERMIGLDETVDIKIIINEAGKQIASSDDNYLTSTLSVMSEIVAMINSASGFTAGTMNLIQGHADQLEVFIYKAKQRIK